MSTGEWLAEWYQAEYGVDVDASRTEILTRGRYPGRTQEQYASILRVHLIPALGDIPLAALSATDLRRYFADLTRTHAESSLRNHCILLNRSLAAAADEGLIPDNPAKRAVGKPRSSRDETPESVLSNCWDHQKALRFLAAARAEGPQAAALYTLALDSGARKGELRGLQWRDIDFAAGTIRIEPSLTRAGAEPIYGRTKGRRARRLLITPDTLSLLRAHREHQAALRRRVGWEYHDLGLVFARENQMRFSLGYPLQSNTLGQRRFARIIKAAGVRPITFHGLRHTWATLLLTAGVPVHYVSERLGHRTPDITLRVYGHCIVSGHVDLIRVVGVSSGRSPCITRLAGHWPRWTTIGQQSARKRRPRRTIVPARALLGKNGAEGGT